MVYGVVEGLGPDLDVTETTMIALVDGHPFGEVTPTERILPLAELRVVAPVLPSKIIAVARNYADHAAEMGGTVLKRAFAPGTLSIPSAIRRARSLVAP